MVKSFVTFLLFCFSFLFLNLQIRRRFGVIWGVPGLGAVLALVRLTDFFSTGWGVSGTFSFLISSFSFFMVFFDSVSLYLLSISSPYSSVERVKSISSLGKGIVSCSSWKRKKNFCWFQSEVENYISLARYQFLDVVQACQVIPHTFGGNFFVQICSQFLYYAGHLKIFTNTYKSGFQMRILSKKLESCHVSHRWVLCRTRFATAVTRCRRYSIQFRLPKFPHLLLPFLWRP